MTLVGLARPFWNPSLKLAIYYIHIVNQHGTPEQEGENPHNPRWSGCSAIEQAGTASHLGRLHDPQRPFPRP